MNEPIRILIVEDLPTDAELAQREICKALKTCQFQRVETREDFLSALQKFAPEIIISDFSMPRFNGLEVLMLALEHAKFTPVIILTSAINEDTAVECMKAGAVDYVIKEHIKRLGQAVIHALDEKQIRAKRRMAEEALSQSEERLRQIAENIDSVFFVFDLDGISGRFSYLNPAFEKIYGIKQEDVLLEPLILARIVHPDDYKNYKGFFRQFLETGGLMKEIQYRIIHSDESIHWIKLKATSVCAPDGRIIRIVGIAEDITDLRKAEEEIQASLEEKQILLQELYHRTKNNMQVISSMLSLQSDYTKNKKMTTIFKEMENRIHSMSLIHKKLYESQNLSKINMREYIYELVDLLMRSYRISSDRISLSYDMTDVSVLIDIAIPCGLILNELISNAFKHAFPHDCKGEINIKLCKTGDGMIDLRIADNGVGVEQGYDFRSNAKMGLKIVLALAEYQLKGKVTFESNNGTVCLIQFKDMLYEARV